MNPESAQRTTSLVVDRFRDLEASATLAINERSKRLKQTGKTVYRFGLGQSPFPVPPVVVDALRAAAHEKDYHDVQGYPPLRDAVAAHHNRHEGTSYSRDDIIIGPGSKELLFMLQMIFDGEVLLPSPCWVSYAPQAHILNRPVRHIDTSAMNGWRLSPQDLEKAALHNPNSAKLLILNYPGNPDGLTYTIEQLSALATVARAHNIIVLSDEIYGLVHHKGEHVSMARVYPEGTIISSGLSKWCGAGGWRLGTHAYPQNLRTLLKVMCSIASETFTSVAAPIQYAACTAYSPNSEIDDYLVRSRAVLALIAEHMLKRLRQADIMVQGAEGGFYLWLDFGQHREALNARGLHTSPDLCNAILNESSVAILPGTAFGRPAKELTARLAYVDFDGAAALANLPEGSTGPSERLTFLEEFCGHTLEGLEQLLSWVGTSYEAPTPSPQKKYFRKNAVIRV